MEFQKPKNTGSRKGATRYAKNGADRARLVVMQEQLVGSDYTADESELLAAIDRYKRETGTKFPSFVEVLRVARGLGWVRDPAQALDRDPVIGDFVAADAIPWDHVKDERGRKVAAHKPSKVSAYKRKK